jgi:hypothetical protein
MWFPTENEAVEMFARCLAARHRAGASRRARGKAESLKNQGDLAGHKIWNDIADAVDRIRADGPPHLRSRHTLVAGRSLHLFSALAAHRPGFLDFANPNEYGLGREKTVGMNT